MRLRGDSMENVKLPERQVPIFARTDVIIAGGGVAGIAAAVSVVRQGCKAILIDDGGILGGTVTKCLMPNFGSSSNAFIKGIFAEICDQLRQRGAIIENEGRSSPCDPEAFRSILFEVVAKEGIELLLHSQVFDVIRHNKQLRGVFITGKSGIQAVTGEVVIDATGDANVAAMAGESFAENGERQPMTLMFTVGNANARRFATFMRDYPDKNEFTRQGNPMHVDVEKVDENHPMVGAWGFFNLIKKARENGGLELPHDNLAVSFLPLKGVAIVNATNVSHLDPLNVKDLTSAEIESRKQMLSIYRFLKNNIPGFEESYINESGSCIGIRESRRLIGEYVLTKEDVLNGGTFPDAIALNGGRISIHGADGKQTWIPLQHAYQVPYRCLQAKVNDNLLVAGRCISTDHVAQGSMRNVSSSFATGQAAGTAAALSVIKQVPPKQLDIKILQKALIDQRAVLSEG
jgi:hypothetical protein